MVSAYYNTAARIIVLLEETCNLLIQMARKFLDPASIFQIEVRKTKSKPMQVHRSTTNWSC